MMFRPRVLIISLLVFGFLSCTDEPEPVETVIEDSETNTIVVTDWRPEQGTDSKESVEPIRVESEKARAPAENGYFLQLGAFVNSRNAAGLVSKLEKKGYYPFISESTSSKKRWHIVRLGPYKSRQKAEKAGQVLSHNEQMTILVMHKGSVVKKIEKPEKKASPATQTDYSPHPSSAAMDAPLETELKKTEQPSRASLDESPEQLENGVPKETVKRPYSFQVGGLYSAEDAKQQMKAFQKKGYAPYLIKTIDDETQEIGYTIQIGRYKTLEEAVKEAADFSKKEKMPTEPRSMTY